MNTDDRYLTIARTYYQEMVQKNFDEMGKHLHPDVVLISPLDTISGKETVVMAAKNLVAFLKDIIIRAQFSSGDQIMLAYDFIFQDPIGKLRSSVLMHFTHDLISQIELFYDARPFVNKKIFSS